MTDSRDDNERARNRHQPNPGPCTRALTATKAAAMYTAKAALVYGEGRSYKRLASDLNSFSY